MIRFVFLFFYCLQFVHSENVSIDNNEVKVEESIQNLPFIKICLLYNGKINRVDIIRSLHFCKNRKDMENALQDFHFEKFIIEVKDDIFYITIQDAKIINNISFHLSILNNDQISKRTYDTSIWLGYYDNYLKRIKLPQYQHQYKQQINRKDIAASLEELKHYFIASGYTNVSIDYRIEFDEKLFLNNLKYYIFLDGYKRQSLSFEEYDRVIRKDVYKWYKLLSFDKDNFGEFFNYFDMRYISKYLSLVKNAHEEKNYHGVEYDFFYDDIQKILYLKFKNKVKSDIILKKIKYSDNVKYQLNTEVLNKIKNVLKEDISIKILKIKIEKILENYYFECDYTISVTNVYDNGKINVSIFISTKFEGVKKVLRKINILGSPNYMNYNSLSSILPYKIGDMVSNEDLNKIKNSNSIFNQIQILPIVSPYDSGSFELNFTFPEKNPWWISLLSGIGLNWDRSSGEGFTLNLKPEFSNINGSLWGGNISLDINVLNPLKSSIRAEMNRELCDNGKFYTFIYYYSGEENFSLSGYLKFNNLIFGVYSKEKIIEYSFFEIEYLFSSSYLIKDIKLMFQNQPFFRMREFNKYGFGLKNNFYFTYEFDKFDLQFSGNVDFEQGNGNDEFKSLGFFNSLINPVNSGLNIFNKSSRLEQNWIGWDFMFRLNIHILYMFKVDFFIISMVGNHDKDSKNASAILFGFDIIGLKIGYKFIINPGVYDNKSGLLLSR